MNDVAKLDYDIFVSIWRHTCILEYKNEEYTICFPFPAATHAQCALMAMWYVLSGVLLWTEIIYEVVLKRSTARTHHTFTLKPCYKKYLCAWGLGFWWLCVSVIADQLHTFKAQYRQHAKIQHKHKCSIVDDEHGDSGGIQISLRFNETASEWLCLKYL